MECLPLLLFPPNHLIFNTTIYQAARTQTLKSSSLPHSPHLTQQQVPLTQICMSYRNPGQYPAATIAFSTSESDHATLLLKSLCLIITFKIKSNSSKALPALHLPRSSHTGVLSHYSCTPSWSSYRASALIVPSGWLASHPSPLLLPTPTHSLVSTSLESSSLKAAGTIICPWVPSLHSTSPLPALLHGALCSSGSCVLSSVFPNSSGCFLGAED